ncbi:thiamine-phosphate kinase [uncultured Microbulbifer sp.]|uniref:thiamine-phosphate kinase n=1 Tax=uncultured Microbulbifer sp. TaxID=348147 RepID=UPI00260D7E86|nr:thiamine-phosphate kinase [uncultured Microbulbifer sp.]
MEHAPGEFDIIRDYFASAPQGEGVALGIGDDCALLQVPAQGQLAASVDTLVAGRHFPVDADPAAIAARALRVNLSDLAAMNARPLWFTLALTLPHSDADWLQRFAAGLLNTARLFGISLVGGDTTAGPLSITIQVLGQTLKPLCRGGARPGDSVYISGPLGGAAAALPVILGERPAEGETRRSAERAFYYPEPQFAIAASIAGLASSAVDISDGLLADLAHICTASAVSADVYLERLAIAPLARALAGKGALALAAGGGDDYQLCFTVPQARVSALQKLEPEAVAIGTLGSGEAEVRCWQNGKRWRVRRTGYRHF